MRRRSRRLTVALGMATAAFISMPQGALAIANTGGPGRRPPGRRPPAETLPADEVLREAPGLKEAPGLPRVFDLEQRDDATGDVFGLDLLERNVEYENG